MIQVEIQVCVCVCVLNGDSRGSPERNVHFDPIDEAMSHDLGLDSAGWPRDFEEVAPQGRLYLRGS